MENTPKLEALLNAVNSDDNSHLITIPPGPHVLSDILLSSPIVQGEDGGIGSATMATGGGGGAAAEGFAEFGVDPTMDPEFAWALRVSMEEERARQEAEAKKRAEESGAESVAAPEGEPATAGEESKTSSSDAVMADAAPAASTELDEAALLEAAIAMSMPAEAAAAMSTPTLAPPPVTPGAPAHPVASKATGPTPSAVPDVAMADADTAGAADAEDDEALQLALAMSMSQGTPAPETAAQSLTTASAPAASSTAVFQDANFLHSVLSSLPGVDPSDPRIQSVLSGLPKEDEKKDDSKKE